MDLRSGMKGYTGSAPRLGFIKVMCDIGCGEGGYKGIFRATGRVGVKGGGLFVDSDGWILTMDIV
jgi:hypothetical protein